MVVPRYCPHELNVSGIHDTIEIRIRLHPRPAKVLPPDAVVAVSTSPLRLRHRLLEAPESGSDVIAPDYIVSRIDAPIRIEVAR